MDTYCLRLTPGQDLKRELDLLMSAKSWSAACILTGIGSLSSAALRFADAPDAEIMQGSFEIISMAGTLARNGSHLHMLIADDEGAVRGGHLKEGAIIRTTAEIVIGILSNWDFKRSVDPETGFSELTTKEIPVSKRVELS